jgi:hypothetical protein
MILTLLRERTKIAETTRKRNCSGGAPQTVRASRHGLGFHLPLRAEIWPARTVDAERTPRALVPGERAARPRVQPLGPETSMLRGKSSNAPASQQR